MNRNLKLLLILTYWVFIVPFTSFSQNISCLPNDTICLGDSVQLSINVSGPVIWSNGMSGTTIVVWPSINTPYTAYFNNGIQNDSSSITLYVLNKIKPQIFSYPSGGVCPNDSLTLYLNNPQYPLMWNTGSNNDSIKIKAVNSSLSYFAFNNYGTACEDSASFTITLLNTLTFIDIHPTSICEGDTSYINLINATGIHYWSTGDSATSYVSVHPDTTTDYFVVNNAMTGCADTILFTVNVNPSGNTNIISSPGDTVCYGERVELQLANPTGTQLWQNQFTEATFAFEVFSNTQVVCINDYLGSCTDTIAKIIFVKYPVSLIVPNVFTPNNDFLNDDFCLQISDLPKGYYYLFDRWGNKVFQTEELNRCWKAEQAKNHPDGNYFMVGEYYDECLMKTIRFAQFILLTK